MANVRFGEVPLTIILRFPIRQHPMLLALTDVHVTHDLEELPDPTITIQAGGVILVIFLPAVMTLEQVGAAPTQRDQQPDAAGTMIPVDHPVLLTPSDLALADPWVVSEALRVAEVAVAAILAGGTKSRTYIA